MTDIWIHPITIGDAHTGDGMRHDGFVDVHIGVVLSNAAVDLLNELVPAKRPSVDSIVCIGTTLKVVAKPKRNGAKRTENELHKMAEGAVSTLNAWAKSLRIGDIAMCIGNQVTEELIKAAMATNSNSVAFYGADHSG